MPAIPIDLVRDLLRHMEWADASVWRAVVTCPASADDNRLRVVLLHMHGVQRAFLSVWTSQPPPAPPSGDMPGLPDLQQSARSYYERARDPRVVGPHEYVQVPTGVALSTEAVQHAPREWAARRYTDLRHWTEFPRGGHFLALEAPELLAADLRAFFRQFR